MSDAKVLMLVEILLGERYDAASIFIASCGQCSRFSQNGRFILTLNATTIRDPTPKGLLLVPTELDNLFIICSTAICETFD